MDIKAFQSPLARAIIVGAALVILVAGIKSAVDLVSPIVFAMFLAIIISPALGWLESRKVPRGLAILLILLLVVIIGAIIILFLFLQIDQLQAKLPGYQQALELQVTQITELLKPYNINISDVSRLDALQPAALATTGLELLVSLATTLSTSFLVLLLLIFMLISAPSMAEKLRSGIKVNESLLEEGAIFGQEVRSYMLASTQGNLFVAGLFTVLLWILGVDFALLWGLLAAILSYIPTIGLVLAAAPAVLIALVGNGWISAVIVIAGAVIINFIGDNIIMPRLATKAVSLTALTVLLSFILWAWIFGILGGLFSVPLTLGIKALLQGYPDTKWLAELMSSKEK